MRIPILRQIEVWRRARRDLPIFGQAAALLAPQAVDGFRKCRAGAEGDGGYVMLDDLGSITTAVSAGIGREDSWDVAMADRGVPVLQFDHTVAGAPTTHPLCTFHRKKIVARPSANADETTLDEIVRPLAGDVILKLDIEGDEYDVLRTTPPEILLKFRQIVCEFHKLHQITKPQSRQTVFDAFHRLATSHAIIHVHANNCGGVAMIGGIAVPKLVELSFVRRRDYRLRDSDETFPTALDRPNSSEIPDLPLSQFLGLGARRRS
jgi:hypothetical protein